MNLNSLVKVADSALKQIDLFIKEEGNSHVLNSIKEQILFIKEKALQGKNPVKELENGKMFTYAILASKEFASPREEELHETIYEVTRALNDL